MRVACPYCWHSVVTVLVCRDCGNLQCLEYEGPKCKTCGGPCRREVERREPEQTAATPNS